MYPHPRPSPRTAAAANSLQTNPTRTNNQRDPASERSSPYSDAAPYSDRGADDDSDMVARTEHASEADQKQNHKANQVIQNFFTKAALTIVSSRTVLPPSYNSKTGDLRQNKWFNVVLDESDVLQQELMEWRTMDAMSGQHPSLCVEIYLDIKGLGHKQSLVIHDEQGKRWDVAEALNVPVESTSRPPSRMGKSTQLVIERWKIHVGDKNSVHPAELSDPLPNVYKKAVVLFRSLYAYLRFIPAHKYYKSIAKQPANHPSLKLNYRVFNGDFKSPRPDTLSTPLYPSNESVTEFQEFTPSNSPVGPLCISVQYRTNCEFSVEDSESLLSSHFMGIDHNYMEQSNRSPKQVPGSLPVNKLHPQETPDLGQAYGSMSTFHQAGPPPGTSPMSALRAARDMPSSPTESPPQKLPPNHRTAQGSKSSLRSTEAPSYQRRTSVSFQPFKAGSLSSSPAPGPAVPPSPGTSVGRPSSSLGRNAVPSALNQPRNRTSLTALPQTALRTPSLTNDNAITSSASSSPKPAPIARYSSSFGHRRRHLSIGGGSKTEDENLSSGKASVASSQQRGSGDLNEAEGGSSGSVKTDDENISDFLKLLESKKELKSFNKSDNASRDATMRKTTAQLSKYQRMREPYSTLSDSISSSMMLHRSSSSSSRQLSSVPPMVAGTSFSPASSPGKPISPHTPHTPAIPSRLSANSIIEYEPRRSRSRPRHASREQEPVDIEEQSEADDQATTAIDIPTSPRPWNYIRRSSSVAQQQNRAIEEDTDFFGLRSASLPVEEVDRERDLHGIAAPDLTSSGLFAQAELHASSGRDEQAAAALNPPSSRDDLQRPMSTSDLPAKRGTYSSSTRGRGGFSSHGSSTSLAAGATSSTERHSRYSFPRSSMHNDDDEPLLFQMSEIGAGSRRSLEEARGGSNTGSGGRRGSPWMR